VNTVSPGYTETEMLTDPQFRTIGTQASPFGRLDAPVVLIQPSCEALHPIAGTVSHVGGGPVTCRLNPLGRPLVYELSLRQAEVNNPN
jgi:hypothetical protein